MTTINIKTSSTFTATKIAMAMIAVAILAIFSAGKVNAQGLPQTDLWLATIEEGIPLEPARINASTGYNNQPHFSVDGSAIYYTREMPGSDGAVQTDIAEYALENKATRMVNASAESEYSPTPVPGRNALSVIRQDLDGKQLLFAIDISSGAMELLLAGIEPVGYHAWYSDKAVAMFILGDSFTLQTAVLTDKVSHTIADNIGRTIRKHPQTGEVLFVDKNHEPWQIAAWDPVSKKTRLVLPLFPAGEDFTIDANGDYWSGNDSRLYRRSPTDNRWNLMVDFSAQGIGHITRLAINPAADKIAIVSDHVSPE